MARKLKPEEAEVFNGAMDEAIPTGPEEFVKSLLDPDPDELTPIPGMWINRPPENPPGS